MADGIAPVAAAGAAADGADLDDVGGPGDQVVQRQRESHIKAIDSRGSWQEPPPDVLPENSPQLQMADP